MKFLPWFFSAILCLSAPLQAVERRLIPVLSIDQMRYDYRTRFAPLFKGDSRPIGGSGRAADGAFRFTEFHRREPLAEVLK